MAYENIKLSKANFVVIDSYFYFLDETKNTLVCKVDDGDTAFEYPTDTDVGTAVKSLQYDGYYFWSLQNHPSGGLLFKKWAIKNFICVLIDTLEYISGSGFIYSAEAFGVEHYKTYITSIANTHTDTLYINEYYDSAVTVGTKLILGPNNNKQREEVEVATVIAGQITLTTNTLYKYSNGDLVCLCNSFFVFNNYDGIDPSKGTLIRFDSYSGHFLSSIVDVDYKDVNAATFYRFQNVLPNYPDAHSLVYVKNTNAKLLDMSNLINLTDATSFNDDFTGVDHAAPRNDLWSVTNGAPEILNNMLSCSTAATGHNSIESNYHLIGDFEVQVSGTVGSVTSFSGTSGSLEHYIEVASTSNNTYNFGISYTAGYTSTIFEEDFTLGGGNWQNVIGVADYSLGYLKQTTDGAIARTIDTINYVDDYNIVFMFKNSGRGSSNDTYLVNPLYIDTNNRLSVVMYTYNASSSYYVQLSKRINSVSTELYKDQKYNYYNLYGTWFSVRLIRTNNKLYFRVWMSSVTEPVIWDYVSSEAATADLPSQSQFYSWAQYTVANGTGLDAINISNLVTTDITTNVFSDDFSLADVQWTSLVGTTVYTNGYLNHMTDDASARTTDTINFGTKWDIQFRFKNHGRGVGNDQYWVSPIHLEVANKLAVYMRTYSYTDNYIRVYSYVDGVITTLFTSTKYNYYNYYGTWFNVRMARSDDFIYFKVWIDFSTEPTNWDYVSPTAAAGIPTQGVFNSHASYTGGAGTGLDDILVKTYEVVNYSEVLHDSINAYIKTNDTLVSEVVLYLNLTTYPSYFLKVTKTDNILTFDYKTTISGVYEDSWNSLSVLPDYNSQVTLSLGATANSLINNGVYFDDLLYTSGNGSIGELATSFGVMNMDNIRADQVTNIAVYDLAINGGTMYRLQLEATYYGTNNGWATYNYQTAPIRPFVDFITLGAEPIILPADGKSVSVITAIVQDQYGNGMINKPVSFTDDNATGYITIPQVYTDAYSATGKATTVYKSGTDVTPVIIEGTATQYN
jgi:hypothetical protein